MTSTAASTINADMISNINQGTHGSAPLISAVCMLDEQKMRVSGRNLHLSSPYVATRSEERTGTYIKAIKE